MGGSDQERYSALDNAFTFIEDITPGTEAGVLHVIVSLFGPCPASFTA